MNNRTKNNIGYTSNESFDSAAFVEKFPLLKKLGNCDHLPSAIENIFSDRNFYVCSDRDRTIKAIIRAFINQKIFTPRIRANKDNYMHMYLKCKRTRPYLLEKFNMRAMVVVRHTLSDVSITDPSTWKYLVPCLMSPDKRVYEFSSMYDVYYQMSRKSGEKNNKKKKYPVIYKIDQSTLSDAMYVLMNEMNYVMEYCDNTNHTFGEICDIQCDIPFDSHVPVVYVCDKTYHDIKRRIKRMLFNGMLTGYNNTNFFPVLLPITFIRCNKQDSIHSVKMPYNVNIGEPKSTLAFPKVTIKKG